MNPPAMRIIVMLAVIAIAAIFATAIGASSLTSGAKLTVVPPAYYAGSDKNDTLAGFWRQ